MAGLADITVVLLCRMRCGHLGLSLQVVHSPKQHMQHESYGCVCRVKHAARISCSQTTAKHKHTCMRSCVHAVQQPCKHTCTPGGMLPVPPPEPVLRESGA